MLSMLRCSGALTLTVQVILVSYCNGHFDASKTTLDEVLAKANEAVAGDSPLSTTYLRAWDILTEKPTSSRAKRAVVQHKGAPERWPGAVVPYVFDSEKLSGISPQFEEAKKEIESQTCIRFVPKENQHTHWINIYKGVGCWGQLGMITEATAVDGASFPGQPLSLGTGCESTAVIMHELMHALGMEHEQVRPDRDEQLVLVEANILPGKLEHFAKMSVDDWVDYGSPYDFRSLMHYGQSFMSIAKNKKTMDTFDYQWHTLIGNMEKPSAGDVFQLRRTYNCSGQNKDATVELILSKVKTVRKKLAQIDMIRNIELAPLTGGATPLSTWGLCGLSFIALTSW